MKNNDYKAGWTEAINYFMDISSDLMNVIEAMDSIEIHELYTNKVYDLDDLRELKRKKHGI